MHSVGSGARMEEMEKPLPVSKDLARNFKQMLRPGRKDPTDLSKLHRLLTKAGIKHIYREHPYAKAEPQVLGLIGYFPTGTHQIIIGESSSPYCIPKKTIPKKTMKQISIIRGAVSFGDFELYGRGFDCERFYTEEEVLEEIKKSL